MILKSNGKVKKYIKNILKSFKKPTGINLPLPEDYFHYDFLKGYGLRKYEKKVSTKIFAHDRVIALVIALRAKTLNEHR